MASDRRDLISDLYHRALARAPEDRAAFLIEACQGDEALREEVASLLEFEPGSARLLERPAVAVAAAAMGATSMIGRQLGPYTIVAPLGAGGMGEVYRARDSKLGRDVAVKILPAPFTADSERRARFAREARTLATLNHPHIGAIYGLEEADGMTALVLELVEGRTLADRLERGPLPVPQALAVARQIATALEAAHEKGVIHRDLKPANIVLEGSLDRLSNEVQAKVLDFGLAKPMAVHSTAAGQPLSGSFDGTADGRLLGTPAYMSPEQARGSTVDKRTDIWAFGCVLFEMLTGRPAFTGDTLPDIVAAVLEDGDHFLYLAGDTAFELRAGSLTSSAPADLIGPFESHAAYADGYLFFVRGGNLMTQRFDAINRKLLAEPIDLGRRTGVEPHNQRGMFAVSPAGPLVYRATARSRMQLTWIDRDGFPRGTVGDLGTYYNFDLSPDERRLAVARMTERAGRAEFEIWTIELSTGNATPLTDDYPAWQFDPAWSPDGTRLAFNKLLIRPHGRFGLFTLPADGGGRIEAVVPPETSPGVSGVHWSRGDIIVYDTGGSVDADLWTIAMSGDRKPKKFLDTKYREIDGVLSPDGRWIAHMSNAPGSDEVLVRPFPAKEPPIRVSRAGGGHPDWRRDGKELFFLAPDGSMMAARFDAKTGAVAAPERLFATPLRFGNRHPYVVSADGQRFLIPFALDDPPRMVLDWRALMSR